jgi:DNA-binding NarL/FixJ family response regulator
VIRVVVADDHPMVRDGLRALLTSVDTMELVGEAATGREAVRVAVTERPDVLVMDLHMPEMDGTAATAEIARVAPSVAVLVLTMLDTDESVFAAMRVGAAHCFRLAEMERWQEAYEGRRGERRAVSPDSGRLGRQGAGRDQPRPAITAVL